MKSLLLVLSLLPTAGTLLQGLAADDWVIVDDRVMGGRSLGSVGIDDDGILVFAGMLSLENNGGFSSVRLPLREGLGGHDGIRMQVRGDGRRYQLRLRNGYRFDGVSWVAEFEATESWSEIELPFDRFKPGFRGRAVPRAGPVEPPEVRQVGLLLADKRSGAFRVEIRDLEAYVEGGE